jgi:hypothetical protein
MSLDVYSHVIVPDEVDPKMLGALLSGEVAAKRRARDAPAIAQTAQTHSLNGKARICVAFR